MKQVWEGGTRKSIISQVVPYTNPVCLLSHLISPLPKKAVLPSHIMPDKSEVQGYKSLDATSQDSKEKANAFPSTSSHRDQNNQYFQDI